ncbi:hypothetical protein [Emticicia sp. W12TSBA100-4]|uniref:hypothetical protein n=1 Tax=Emticicia sp. W12TSBA100-4 TaxID=3160965 RepID=UPI003305D7BA
MEKLRVLETEKVKNYLTKKDISPASVAEKLGMTKQNFYILLKKEYFKPDVSENLISLFGENFTETELVKEKENKGVSVTVEKMLELMDENRKLWSVIARHGISVNFNGVSGFATVFLGLFFCLY